MKKTWKLSVDDLKKAASLYKGGASLGAVAVQVGVTRQALHQLFHRYGVKVRDRKAARRISAKNRDARIRAALKEGK